jgi:RNA polymerase sigma factor (sigma-70 family)
VTPPRDGRARRPATPPTPEDFARFLDWLAEDGSPSGTYVEARARLVRFFLARGCHEAERCADEVLDRVVAQIRDLADSYRGARARYLYAVARNVLREWWRHQAVEVRHAAQLRPAPAVPVEARSQPGRKEREQVCLERCLAALEPAERGLLERYYASDPGARAGDRRRLADEQGVSLEALRQRTHRMRERLKDCLLACLAEDE